MCRPTAQTNRQMSLSAAGQSEEEEAVLPEEVEDVEEYGSPRETARDDASSCSEGDYRALLGSPLRTFPDGKSAVLLRSLLSMPAATTLHAPWLPEAKPI